MSALNAQQAALRARLHNLVFRGVLTRVRNGGGALVAQAAGRAGELRDNIVLVYPFGFAAWPVDAGGDRGPEAVVIQFEGNARAALPPMDRRHWAKSGVTEADEASLYTTTAKVLIKASGDIEITSPGKVRVDAADIELHASGSYSWDVDGYGQRVTSQGGGAYEVQTWQEGAVVVPVTGPINPPEGP